MPRDDTPIHPAIDAVNNAVELGQQGRFDEALSAFDAVVTRFEDASAAGARAGVAGAMVNKGVALQVMGDEAGAIEALRLVEERFRADDDPWVQSEVAAALRARAILLAQAGRIRDSLVAFDEAVSRFGTREDAAARSWAAEVLTIKLAVLADHLPDAAPATAHELAQRFGGDTDSAIREHVDDELTRCATKLAELGRTDDAVSVFGDVIQLHGEHGDAVSRSLAAMGYYNSAVALRDARRYEDALVEFESGLKLVSDAEPSTLSMVVRLLYNKSVVLLDLDRLEDAVDGFGEVERRFRDAPDDDIRRWVARSVYHRGSALILLHRLDEALAAWTTLQPAPGAAEDDATTDVIAGAQDARQWLEAMRVRPHHIRRHPFEQSMAKLYATWLETGIDPESGNAVSAATAEEYIALQRRQLEQSDALAGELHDAAVATLWGFSERDRPFGLFLRNFDLEAYAAEGSQGRLLWLGGDAPTGVENRIMTSLAGQVPMVGIANAAHRVHPKIGFDADIMPRLEVSDDTWKARVDDLLRNAAIIFIAAYESSPGLLVELQAIRAHERQEQTVVVLADLDDALDSGLAHVYGAELPHRQALRADGPELRDFPLVLAEDAVPWDRVPMAQGASDVLTIVAETIAAGSGRRKHRRLFGSRRR